MSELKSVISVKDLLALIEAINAFLEDSFCTLSDVLVVLT